jgi:mannosyltransferase OCH1-like enzyme
MLTFSLKGCLRSLDALVYYPTWTTDGGRGALSNNILATTPNHTFWQLLTDSLIPYNYNYFFPYVTISFASGQWFETAIWEKYHAALPRIREEGTPENRLYRIMMDDRPGTDPWIFFTQERGGTWKNWDNEFFLWIGDHKLLLSLIFLALFGLSVYGCVRCYNGKRRGYAQVKREEDV